MLRLRTALLTAVLIILSSRLFSGFTGYQVSNNTSSPAAQPETTTLWVTVLDEKHHLVPDLKSDNFEVYVDDQPQQIVSVQHEDAAASIGIVVDNSGSM